MMSEHNDFMIEQFYKYINQRRLMGGKCQKCGKVHLPPRPLCDKCFSRGFEWVELPETGELLTYTVIHVAPPQFESMTPYTVGIVQIEDGLRIPGIIREAPPNQVKIGMKLKVVFEDSDETHGWPRWPRYYFTPA